MGDVERITTTERHAELRDQIAHRIKETAWHLHVPGMPGLTKAEALVLADAVLPIIERERVRVVEGLIATIKALDLTTEVRAEADGHAVTNFTNVDSVGLAAVLAVVEAAREDTT